MPDQIKADGGGLRFNGGKNQVDLIPPEWTLAVGEVMTKGALKYAPHNWERGMKWSIMVGCALRHLLRFVSGETYDSETGCHHLAHVAWNALALMSYDVRGVGENDIPAVPLVKPTSIQITPAGAMVTTVGIAGVGPAGTVIVPAVTEGVIVRG